MDDPATTIGASPSSTATLTPAATVPVAPVIDKTKVTSQIDIIVSRTSHFCAILHGSYTDQTSRG